jgi:hypothetical protein
MKFPRLLLALLFASGFAIGPRLVAQDNNPQLGHWSCRSIIVDNTMYVSAVFDETALMDEVQTGFAQLLVAKYGFKDHVSCGMAYMSGSTLAGLQAGQQDQLNQLRKQGRKVVETGWVFVPTKASLPYVCFGAVTVRKDGQSQGYYYVTRVLGVPGSVLGDMETAWREYLKGLHPGFLFNPLRCNLFSADPASHQTQLKNLEDQYKGYGYEISPVDWTYRQGQAATQPDQSPAYYCQMLSADGKTWYASAVLPVEETWNLASYNKAWLSFASGTLKLDPANFRGGCESGPMQNEQETRAARKEQLNGTAGEKIVEVDWKYTPGQSAAPAASGPPPAGPTAAASTAPSAHPATPASPAGKPTEIPYFCQTTYRSGKEEGQPAYYVSHVFSTATPLQTINQEWQKYLVDAYHLAGQVRGQCRRVSPNPAAQQALLNAITNVAAASKAQIVKVDWQP